MKKCPENPTDDDKCYCDGPGCQADEKCTVCNHPQHVGRCPHSEPGDTHDCGHINPVEIPPKECCQHRGKQSFDFVGQDVVIGDLSKLQFPWKRVEQFLTCTSCWQRLADGENHVCSKPRPDGKVSAVVTPGYGGSAIPQYARDLFREREILKARVSMLEQQLLADRLIAEVMKEERDRLADEHLKQMCAKAGEVYDAQAQVKRFQEREQHFASVLKVADGGQYRADWDASIRAVIDARDALAFALRDVMRYADPHAVPGCDKNVVAHETAKEMLTTFCPGCRGKYTESEKHTCVPEGS